MNKLALIPLCLTLAACGGCSATGKLLEGVDYGCINIQANGYFTASRATGRAIKVPDGVMVDEQVIETLCNE